MSINKYTYILIILAYWNI